MEILLFSLGIVFALVIGLAVVGAVAFFKVIKVQKEVNDFDRSFSDVYQRISEENRHIHSRVDGFEKDIYSQLDSRLDKLENKLTNKK